MDQSISCNASAPIVWDASCVKPFSEQLVDTVNALNSSSMTQYETKLKLIVASDDMTTQEKINAMDQNLAKLHQDMWMNLGMLCLSSLFLYWFAKKCP